MPSVDRILHSGGEQRLAFGAVSRHRHRTPYAALVLQGRYLERGSSGRWEVRCGCVVSHHAFEAHDDRVWTQHATVLNIPLPAGTTLPPVFEVAAPDDLVRAVRQDPREAHRCLIPLQVRPPEIADWPDLLAVALQDASLRLTDWARQQGLALATVTRGFRAAFGVTPARFRAETRLVRAVRRLTGGTSPLAEIALDCGFSDQAHLSRAVRATTGHTPAQLRVKTIQDRGSTSA